MEIKLKKKKNQTGGSPLLVPPKRSTDGGEEGDRNGVMERTFGGGGYGWEQKGVCLSPDAVLTVWLFAKEKCR